MMTPRPPFPFETVRLTKIELVIGAVLGLLVLVTGLYLPPMLSPGKAGLLALLVFLHFSCIPLILRGSFWLVRPLYMQFDRMCVKRQITYIMVADSRTYHIGFADGTSLGHRFAFGVLFNLISFLQVVIIAGLFGILLLLEFLVVS